MLVEAIFWFHPLVWWIEHAHGRRTRTRLRSRRSCARPGDSEAYAAGILEVCRLYLESPLVCVAGVTGGELKKRIAAILTNPIALPLGVSRKMLLACGGLRSDRRSDRNRRTRVARAGIVRTAPRSST
jgi:hypothetical protein